MFVLVLPRYTISWFSSSSRRSDFQPQRPLAKLGKVKYLRMALGVDSYLSSRKGRVGLCSPHSVEGVVAVSACKRASVARRGRPSGRSDVENVLET